jgi:ubiquitin-conjugating enzyme E2 R
MSATPFLLKQLQELRKTPLGGFRVEVGDNLFEWTVWFSGPKGTLYHPGQYKALLTFPQDFPYKPPVFKVITKMWHPNIYPDGNVCISILHPPGEDEMNTIETAQMRWTPIQSIDKVLLSIVSLLADPDSSDAGAPANVDALVQFRKDRKGFEKTCQENAARSLQELPPGFVPPPEEDVKPVMTREISHLSEPSAAYDCDDDGCDDDDEERHKYADELQQVRNMGLGTELNDEKLLEMLEKCKGDVSRVIEKLC